MPLRIGPTTLTNVVLTHDGGYDCYDTTVSAQDIHTLLQAGHLKYDPKHQRGLTESKTPQPILTKEKVERWTEALQKDDAIFGQLAWNFRPESTDLFFDPSDSGDFGDLTVTGIAYLPDSYHRHMAISGAVASCDKGSSFDLDRRFSLRIWNVPEKFEDRIFHDMNQEHDKADATRSKYLHQRGFPQKLALALVKKSAHFGEANVETVRNAVSAKSPRLVAFNTISTGFERTWDLPDDTDPDEVLPWLTDFWDRLVLNVPQLRIMKLGDRNDVRKESIAASAVAIHAYIHLAWRMYREQKNLAILDVLGEENKKGFFKIDNPDFRIVEQQQERGIVVPNAKGGYRTRNSRQTQDALYEILVDRLGLN